MTEPLWNPAAMQAEVRRQVHDLLDRSPAYRSLDPNHRRQIAADTVAVVAYLANPDGAFSPDFAGGAPARIPLPPEIRPVGELAGELAGEVDFPGFVAGLIQGVFQAIVNASVRQMEAYAGLVASVSKTIEEFLEDGDDDDDHDGDENPRDSLARSYNSDLAPDPRHPRRVALRRQQRLIATLKMGINRIVVTNG